MIDANVVQGLINDLHIIAKNFVAEGYYTEGGVILKTIYYLEEIREDYKKK